MQPHAQRNLQRSPDQANLDPAGARAVIVLDRAAQVPDLFVDVVELEPSKTAIEPSKA